MESLVGRRLGKYELTAMIGGGGMATVYLALDLNGNGVLDQVGGTPEPSTVTDSAGDYVLRGLELGSYVVLEVVPTGYVQTFPTAVAGNRLFAVPANNVDDIVELDPTTGAEINRFAAPGPPDTFRTGAGRRHRPDTAPYPNRRCPPGKQDRPGCL